MYFFYYSNRIDLIKNLNAECRIFFLQESNCVTIFAIIYYILIHTQMKKISTNAIGCISLRLKIERLRLKFWYLPRNFSRKWQKSFTYYAFIDTYIHTSCNFGKPTSRQGAVARGMLEFLPPLRARYSPPTSRRRERRRNIATTTKNGIDTKMLLKSRLL